MSKNLYEANYQWANRPDDERFSSLKEMHAATKAYAMNAVTSTARVDDLRVESDEGNLALVGKTGNHARLTHYSFGQLARVASAPAEYLRRLPATLAAQNINYGLKKIGTSTDDKLSLLFHKNGSLVARAITTDSYDRVWNYEVIEAIQARLAGTGWVVPPARPAREGQAGTRLATEADILPNQGDFGLRIKVGDPIAPAGLYASDHDMFAFLVNQEHPIFDGQKLLNRGVFIQNSEVGDCSLRFKLFTYDNVCGNHIVWGVGQVTDISVRHVKGETQRKGKTLTSGLAKWNLISNQLPDVGAMEKTIARAREMVLGDSKDDALANVFGFARKNGLNMLTKGNLEAAYEIADKTPRYGNPRSVWGLVNGLTEFSQQGHTDTRTELDTQAGRLMEISF